MDVFTAEKRSEIMSRIRGRDTRPEFAVRSLLHSVGFRFRLHASSLPGRPDIVLARYRTVVFVHGCFWHRHMKCRYAYVPKTRLRFWTDKFETNVKRDVAVKKALKRLGWKVIVVWECETRSMDKLTHRLVKALTSDR